MVLVGMQIGVWEMYTRFEPGWGTQRYGGILSEKGPAKAQAGFKETDSFVQCFYQLIKKPELVNPSHFIISCPVLSKLFFL